MVKPIGESLDRRLTLRERISTKLHLLTCEYCQRYLTQISFLKNAARRHADPSDDESFSNKNLSESAKERLRARLRFEIGLHE